VSNYTYPGTDTVKNVFGITDHAELEGIEAALVKARHAEIDAGFGPAGEFDAEHFKAIHKHLFQDVYEWAGRTREERVALSDGTIATMPIMRKLGGQPFSIGIAIHAALDDIEERLRATNCLRDLSREDFSERAADIMAAINTVHPFREGNGRAQRVFMERLAVAAGHSLDFTVISRERMIQASVAAHERADTSMMRRMFDEISNSARVGLLRHALAALDKLNIDWNDRYVATIVPGHNVELVLAGISGDEFMARTASQILFGRVSDLPNPPPQMGQTFTLTMLPRAWQE
jgi:cell filamentation protein